MYFNRNAIKKASKMFIFVLFILFLTQSLYAKKIDKLEFYDQPITDILLALAGIGGVSVVPDETIYGRASFVFVDIEFEEGLRIFLRTYNMYLKIENNIYYVSKINIEYSPGIQLITKIDAEDVNLTILVEAVSKAINKTVLKDSLPTITLSIHQQNIAIKDLLEILIAQAPNHTLVVYPSYYHIQLKPTPTPDKSAPTPDPNAKFFTKTGDLYSIQEERKRFKELLEELFKKEGAEYQLLIQRDVLIDTWIRFLNKTFEQMLRLLCEQGNADYKQINGVYYVFEIAQRDIVKKLKETMIVSLRYITAQDLQRLLPPDLGSSKFYRIDTGNNVIILNGSADEIIPIAEFITMLDQPMTTTQYYRYDLKFIKAANFQALLPEDFKFLKVVQIPDSDSIIIPLSIERKESLDKYVELLDQPLPSSEVRLKYIKSEDLVKNIPPSAKKEDIVITQDPSIIFFKGPLEKQAEFRRELSIFDQPAPQIVYNVLAISYQKQEGLSWQQTDNPNIAISDSSSLNSVISGNIGNLLTANFDIPSILGYHLASYLSLSLNTKNAEILTDTTLYALSGEKVSFNDTEVFRYSVGVTDTTTGEASTTVAGPTESIETGFILTIEGWVSGDGMITMGVDVTISNQGSSADVASGNLGTTSEKSINTKSRTASGHPIKIGGLIRENVNETIEKIPLLGDIPIIGLLFQRKNESNTRSEIVVYILPHIVMSVQEKADTGRRLKRLYTKYFTEESEGI
ncbi:MAG: hypothetical protein JXJ04_17190 [Spirochaetales bacterium]|nr:hypothetical protein [Spirochaetales bacterium]